jgi:hypothetical protein
LTQAIAEPLLYSTIILLYPKALHKLAAHFASHGPRSRFGPWVITLRINIRENALSEAKVWSSLNIILLQTSNLANVGLYNPPINVGCMSTIVHIAQRALRTLTIRIDATNFDALPLIQHFNQLSELSLEITVGFTIAHQPAKLDLPTVKFLHIRTYGDSGGTQDILSYLSSSHYHDECNAVFSMPLGSFPIMDSYFNGHSSSHVKIMLDDAEAIEFPSTSAIFNKSQSVTFDEFVPTPTIFARDRLPKKVTVNVDAEGEELWTANLWSILDLLAQSPVRHDLRLQIKRTDWPRHVGFYWSTKDTDEAGYQDEHASFTTKILRLVKPLRDRGVTILDQHGHSFEEHFGVVFTS